MYLIGNLKVCIKILKRPLVVFKRNVCGSGNKRSKGLITTIPLLFFLGFTKAVLFKLNVKQPEKKL